MAGCGVLMDDDDIVVEIRQGGSVIATASTNVTARDNAGVNPIPDLLRKMADQIEDWHP